jgi:hypothetical protein
MGDGMLFLVLIKLQIFHVFMLLLPFVPPLLAFALLLHIIIQVLSPSHHCCTSLYVLLLAFASFFAFAFQLFFGFTLLFMCMLLFLAFA